jgi:flagellar basal-body rod protein FlgB
LIYFGLNAPLRIMTAASCNTVSFGAQAALVTVENTPMQVTTPTSEALGRYLSLTTAQLKLTASNMANIDTPGYTTQGFDFSREFAKQMQATPDGSGQLEVNPPTQSMDGLVARPDGNNISMDREGLHLAQAQMQFRLGVLLLKGEFSTVATAIHSSDGK